MKKFKFLMLAIGLIGVFFLFNSCDDDDYYSLGDVWASLATINPEGTANAYSLTLDDGAMLWPAASDIPWYKPENNQRAIVFYTILSDQFQGYDYAILVRDIQHILTKNPAVNVGDENDEKYGTDPIEILDMWMGDGYLNVWFGFNYGGGAVHFINLVQREDVNTPYYFEFRHHAYDDTAREKRKGLVAFNLSELNIKEQTTLTIKVNTFDGDKEYKVTYDPAEKETESRSFSKDDIVELQ